MLASLKSVHESLSLERQKLQESWETSNEHRSNTLAVVREMHLALPHFTFLFINTAFHFPVYLPFSTISLHRPTDPPLWQIQLPSTLMPVTTLSGAVPLRCLMNLDSVMEAPPTLNRRRDMVSATTDNVFSVIQNFPKEKKSPLVPSTNLNSS